MNRPCRCLRDLPFLLAAAAGIFIGLLTPVNVYAQLPAPGFLPLVGGIGEPAPVDPDTFPQDAPLFRFKLPEGWTTSLDASNGNVICKPPEANAGYSAVFSKAGTFTTVDQVKEFLGTVARRTAVGIKMADPKISAAEAGKGTGTFSFVFLSVSGRVGSTQMTYVFTCFTMGQGAYCTYTAGGRQDKLAAKGFDVVQAIFNSIVAIPQADAPSPTP